MSIFETYLAGLFIAHLLWFFFFTTGQLLWPRTNHEAKPPPTLSELVITYVAGMALSGFTLLLLGAAHLLNLAGIATAVFAEGILFRLVTGG